MADIFQRWGDLFHKMTRWKSEQSPPNRESQLQESASAATKLAVFISSGVPAARAQELALTSDLVSQQYGQFLLKVWTQVCANGVAPADALHRFATALHHSAENLRHARTMQSGPRYVKKVMMFLPCVALGGSLLLGNNAIEFLAMNPVGWFLLACAGGFMWLGNRWSSRMIETATQSQWTAGISSQLCAMYIASGFPPQDALRCASEVLAGEHCQEIQDIRRLIELGQEEGIQVALLLSGLSEQYLSEAHAMMQERVEALSAKLVLPLGACVLPAFICVGVIPIIFSMLSSTTLS